MLDFNNIINELELVQDKNKNNINTALYLSIRENTRKKLDDIQFKIFWLEKIEAEALKEYCKNKKDEEAKLLAWALQCHHYPVVKQLISQGIKPNETHYAALNYAYLAQQDQDVQSADNKPVFHPVNQFGLTLGIDTVIDGISSQRSHMQGPFNLLTRQLQDYAEELNVNHPHKQNLSDIAEAYEFSKDVLRYSNSRVDPGAGVALTERYKAGKITVVPCGWKGHAISVSIVNGNLVLTNRGAGGDEDYGTKIYKIAHPEKINAQFFTSLVTCFQAEASPTTILNTIGEVIDPNPIMQIAAKRQKRENCTYANPKANVEGILAVLSGQENAHIEYKQMTDHFKRKLGKDLISRYESSYGPDKEMYQNLMKAYIHEHSKNHTKAIDQELINMMSNAMAPKKSIRNRLS